jgi:hypothetical protein
LMSFVVSGGLRGLSIMFQFVNVLLSLDWIKFGEVVKKQMSATMISRPPAAFFQTLNGSGIHHL